MQESARLDAIQGRAHQDAKEAAAQLLARQGSSTEAISLPGRRMVQELVQVDPCCLT